MNHKIEIGVDSHQVKGPRKTDGAYTISFETGEYEAINVAKLLAIPFDSNLKITVEVLD